MAAGFQARTEFQKPDHNFAEDPAIGGLYCWVREPVGRWKRGPAIWHPDKNPYDPSFYDGSQSGPSYQRVSIRRTTGIECRDGRVEDFTCSGESSGATPGPGVTPTPTCPQETYGESIGPDDIIYVCELSAVGGRDGVWLGREGRRFTQKADTTSPPPPIEGIWRGGLATRDHPYNQYSVRTSDIEGWLANDGSVSSGPPVPPGCSVVLYTQCLSKVIAKRKEQIARVIEGYGYACQQLMCYHDNTTGDCPSMPTQTPTITPTPSPTVHAACNLCPTPANYIGGTNLCSERRWVPDKAPSGTMTPIAWYVDESSFMFPGGPSTSTPVGTSPPPPTFDTFDSAPAPTPNPTIWIGRNSTPEAWREAMQRAAGRWNGVQASLFEEAVSETAADIIVVGISDELWAHEKLGWDAYGHCDVQGYSYGGRLGLEASLSWKTFLVEECCTGLGAPTPAPVIRQTHSPSKTIIRIHLANTQTFDPAFPSLTVKYNPPPSIMAAQGMMPYARYMAIWPC